MQYIIQAHSGAAVSLGDWRTNRCRAKQFLYQSVIIKSKIHAQSLTTTTPLRKMINVDKNIAQLTFGRGENIKCGFKTKP